MALTTTITAAHIAVALGQTAPLPDSPQELQWEMWISDALMLIQARVDLLDVDESTVSQAALDYVIREAVVAQVKRPDSATQVTWSVDDGSTSKTYRSAAGRVDIIDEWWTLLGLTPSGGQSFAVDTVGSSSIHQPWCSLMFGGEVCSCGANLAGYPLWEY